MHLSVLTQCSPSPSFEGLWRDPADRTSLYHRLDHWTSLARQLEAACIDTLFFADTHGIYDVYGGSVAAAVRHGIQAPSIDPVLIIPALAAAAPRLGFAVTYSTSYFPPYQCARVFSSLDHLTRGRIGWNIVTSDLRLAERTGLADPVGHDERYDRADEYMEVVLALWERSWEDDAVVVDRAGDVYADPAKVHEIGHEGRWFRVTGPHECEPSPQRTPVLFQAGSSARGVDFAARHAEVVFVTLAGPRRGARKVAEIRRRIADLGRPPDAVKVLEGIPVIVGRDEGDAKAKADRFVALSSAGGLLAKWCGWVGVDLASVPGETPLTDVLVDHGQSVLEFLRRAAPDRAWTVADVREHVATPHRPHRHDPITLFGTAEQVATRMEEWIHHAGIDGFNLLPCPPTSGIDDICSLLVPELQRRGLFRRAYDPEERTLRERLFGAGRTRDATPRRTAEL